MSPRASFGPRALVVATCFLGCAAPEDIGGPRDAVADTEAQAADALPEAPRPVCVGPDGDDYGEGEGCAGSDCDEAAPDVHLGAREACNGRDDDCDLRVDEVGDLVNPGSVEVCLDRGVCVGARGVCDDAAWLCDYSAAYEPGRERSCDFLDNDCDGPVDEDFDLDRDVEHCGACGRRCARPHAVVECAAGRCQWIECEAGWTDQNGRAEDGCETASR